MLLVFYHLDIYTIIGFKADTHYPYIRPVSAGAFFDTCTYSPYVRVLKSTPVNTAGMYGCQKCARVYKYIRVVRIGL